MTGGNGGVRACLFVAVALCLTILPPARAQVRPLVFAFGEHNEAPFAVVEGGRLTGGFALSFGQALAARLGREARFRFVPRNRIPAEIGAGGVDAYCLAARPYYPAFAADRFTQPLFTDQDVILLSASFSGPAELAALKGARVGAVLGYLYPPEVEGMFTQGGAERIDARNAVSNLRKLRTGRLDAAILPLASLTHALHQDPALARSFRADYITIAMRERVCLVSPSSPVTVPEFNLAIRSLDADGQLPAMVGAMGLRTSAPSSSAGGMPAR